MALSIEYLTNYKLGCKKYVIIYKKLCIFLKYKIIY